MPGMSLAGEEHCSARIPPHVCLTPLFVCNLMYSSQYYSLLRHLNTLFLAIDGCFKTKLKECGIKDPDLGTGLAYMVNDDDYAEHLEQTTGMLSEKTVSPNSNPFVQPLTLTRLQLAALISMLLIKRILEIKRATLLLVSLLSLVITHLSIRLVLSIYRRVKSESNVPSFFHSCSPLCRYLNIDYTFASTVSCKLEAGLPHIVITYDIACQWGLKLREWLSMYTATKHVNLGSLQSLRFAVPKFHLIRYRKSCHLNFNLAFMQGVGMTHGESIETI